MQGSTDQPSGPEAVHFDPAQRPRQDAIQSRRDYIARLGWQARPPRILVIEDNVDSAEVLVVLLEVMGFEARAEFDAASGMRTAQAWQPTLVLSDIDLPDATGFEVAGRLSRDPRFRHTPLVALTGRHDERDWIKGLEAGFTRYLHKPIDPEDLRMVLCELLDRRRGGGRCPEGRERRGNRLSS